MKTIKKYKNIIGFLTTILLAVNFGIYINENTNKYLIANILIILLISAIYFASSYVLEEYYK